MLSCVFRFFFSKAKVTTRRRWIRTEQKHPYFPTTSPWSSENVRQSNSIYPPRKWLVADRSPLRLSRKTRTYLNTQVVHESPNSVCFYTLRGMGRGWRPANTQTPTVFVHVFFFCLSLSKFVFGGGGREWADRCGLHAFCKGSWVCEVDCPLF